MNEIIYSKHSWTLVGVGVAITTSSTIGNTLRERGIDVSLSAECSVRIEVRDILKVTTHDPREGWFAKSHQGSRLARCGSGAQACLRNINSNLSAISQVPPVRLVSLPYECMACAGISTSV